MDKNVEKLIKIQGALNKQIYHLYIETNLEDSCRWLLYLYNPNIENYFSEYNRPILSSSVDSIDDLFNYLDKHEGFKNNFRW